jgi:enterochelin esterase family protein
MNPLSFRRSVLAGVVASATLIALPPANSQQPPPGPPGPETCMPRGFMVGPAPYRSVEVLPDGRVTFRMCAPDAQSVSVISSDAADVIPMGIGGGPAGLAMTKDARGLWSVTTEKPVAPDNYRFNFSVNGVKVPDPQSTTFTMDRIGVNSTFELPGEAGNFQAWNRNVPHGTVSVVEYWSSSLGVKRRAHVYTPPGYFKSGNRYPVLYLVHGAGDSDDSWTGTGHAHYILDNLIAAGRAKPMIIVMPFGHTPDRQGGNMLANTDFGDDLIRDLIPHIERNFRTLDRPGSRAMAGLSMGGAHTLRFGLTHPELFRYIGVFSMGLGMGNNGPADIAAYEKENAKALEAAAKDLKLFYYAMGKDDFLYGTVAPTRAMLERQGIEHVYNESAGGHTWINWRRYLEDFAPRLFHD